VEQERGDARKLLTEFPRSPEIEVGECRVMNEKKAEPKDSAFVNLLSGRVI
jgi:hypothetical protein